MIAWSMEPDTGQPELPTKGREPVRGIPEVFIVAGNCVWIVPEVLTWDDDLPKAYRKMVACPIGPDPGIPDVPPWEFGPAGGTPEMLI